VSASISKVEAVELPGLISDEEAAFVEGGGRAKPEPERGTVSSSALAEPRLVLIWNEKREEYGITYVVRVQVQVNSGMNLLTDRGRAEGGEYR
jgi:hypothetical protein